MGSPDNPPVVVTSRTSLVLACFCYLSELCSTLPHLGQHCLTAKLNELSSFFFLPRLFFFFLLQTSENVLHTSEENVRLLDKMCSSSSGAEASPLKSAPLCIKL